MSGEAPLARPAGEPLAHARIDNDGKLIEADARLAALNARAGGTIGAPIAVPQLATLARLAQRLGVLVSRGAIAADGDQDLELWVRAAPDTGGGVRLTVSGWRERPGWRGISAQHPRDVDVLHAGGGWRWATNAALVLTEVSPDLARQAGVALGRLLGHPLTAVFRLADDADGGAPMLAALARHERFDDQAATLRANGRAVMLSAVPRLDGAGRFAGLAGIALPATDVAPADASGLSGAFSVQLDKALRAPLGRIIAHADSIHAQSEGPLRQDYADYAADIASAGRHLLGLVDDLVDLDAIERADFAVVAEPIDLADIARRAAGLLSVRAASATVRIDRPAADEKLPALGEFRRVLQILVNLVGNAVRYSPPGAMVWIRAEERDGQAIIVVADQGKGIAVNDQARIFEKFERVDPSEPGGSGLGLYIARRLARAMGGDISVDSAPGQGARFTLSLPSRAA